MVSLLLMGDGRSPREAFARLQEQVHIAKKMPGYNHKTSVFKHVSVTSSRGLLKTTWVVTVIAEFDETHADTNK